MKGDGHGSREQMKGDRHGSKCREMVMGAGNK